MLSVVIRIAVEMESKMQIALQCPESASWNSSLRGMRVALLVEGSRGDCQPYIALALRLQKEGCIVNEALLD